MNIDENNFQALFAFTMQIKKDLAAHNKRVKMANVKVKYCWKKFENEIETRMIISLDDYPYSTFTLDDKDWLTAESFYVKFSTGYNEFSFDELNHKLIIECKNTSKLGNFYRVEISEIE